MIKIHVQLRQNIHLEYIPGRDRENYEGVAKRTLAVLHAPTSGPESVSDLLSVSQPQYLIRMIPLRLYSNVCVWSLIRMGLFGYSFIEAEILVSGTRQ